MRNALLEFMAAQGAMGHDGDHGDQGSPTIPPSALLHLVLFLDFLFHIAHSFFTAHVRNSNDRSHACQSMMLISLFIWISIWIVFSNITVTRRRYDLFGI